MQPRTWPLGFLVAVFLAAGAAAQGNDDALILPPRIEAADGDSADATGDPAATAPGAQAPGAARLADQPADREQPLELVLVVGEPEWRLPDLGSEWRQAQEEERSTDRIELSFMPLYDPENADPVPDIFERNSELHRLQMIEIIRVRFGGRSRD